MTEAECQQITQSIRVLAERVGDFQLEISQRLSKLEQQVANEGALCPWREAISRASNNLGRLANAETKIDAVEDKVHTLEITIVKAGLLSGAAGGGIFSAVSAGIFAIGRGVGWW